jgi:membrane protease subunit HflC
MKRHIGLIILALLVIGFLLVSTVTFMVDQTRDIVLVTTFGKISRVIDGRTDPGLHMKWPWPIQKLIRFDSRNHVLVSSYRQFNIGEKYNIMATAFCTWRIADARKFYRSKETVESADEALRSLLASQMTGVMGQVKMGELVNTDPQEMKLSQIEAKIRQAVEQQAMEDYGIELTDLGLRTLGLPQSISQKVIEAMKEERNKEISQYEAEGKAVATAITGRAKAAKDKILAFANRKAGDIRTQGEARAAEAYAQFKENPQFSMFLRSLETLRTALADQSEFILDPQMMPILRWLRQKPSLETFNANDAR